MATPTVPAIDRVVGTYLHGALESADVCAELFGIPMKSVAPKHEHYERLADWFDQHGRGLDAAGPHTKMTVMHWEITCSSGRHSFSDAADASLWPI